MSDVQASQIPPRHEPVVLAERIAAGQSFSNLFREGMTLVELAAAYLDGPGRKESKQLSRTGALTYATESMRLTTRLMQLASWLLLQRAVNEGELTQAQARSEKTKVKLAAYEPPHEEAMKALPKRLRTLIEDSRRLHEQVLRMDALIYGGKPAMASNDNPVEHQLGLLRAAFEAKRSA
jgi:regulator of CtrA degradation